jgi:hypothetical protein
VQCAAAVSAFGSRQSPNSMRDRTGIRAVDRRGLQGGNPPRFVGWGSPGICRVGTTHHVIEILLRHRIVEHLYCCDRMNQYDNETGCAEAGCPGQGRLAASGGARGFARRAERDNAWLNLYHEHGLDGLTKRTGRPRQDSWSAQRTLRAPPSIWISSIWMKSMWGQPEECARQSANQKVGPRGPGGTSNRPSTRPVSPLPLPMQSIPSEVTAAHSPLPWKVIASGRANEPCSATGCDPVTS